MAGDIYGQAGKRLWGTLQIATQEEAQMPEAWYREAPGDRPGLILL